MFHILKAKSKISISKLPFKLTISKLIFYTTENMMYNDGKKIHIKQIDRTYFTWHTPCCYALLALAYLLHT